MNEVDLVLIGVARRQHQVFSRAQAREAGLTPSVLAKRLARGSLVAAGPHTLHFPGVTLTYHGRLRAGLLDLGPEALIGGRAAAHLLGLDGFPAGPHEFVVPRNLRNRTTVGTVRSTVGIGRLDRTTVDGLPCTSATRTVIDLLGNATDDEVGNALDSATRLGLTAPAVIARRLAELGRQGRDGVAQFERVRRTGAVESWLERTFLKVVRAARLPPPVLQQRYTLPGVGVARVDFEFPGRSIVVEAGGRRGYLSADERRRQERRRNALQLAGKTVYFFTRAEVVDHPDRVVATLRSALAQEAVTTKVPPGPPA